MERKKQTGHVCRWMAFGHAVPRMDCGMCGTRLLVSQKSVSLRETGNGMTEAMTGTMGNSVTKTRAGKTMMKIPFMLVLLSFLTMVACSNGQSESLSSTRQSEKNTDSIDVAKKAEVFQEDMDDSLFLKRIIDGSFFRSKTV